MKSTTHLTELTLYVFLLFTVVNISKARDGAVSHDILSPVQLTSSSTSQSFVGAEPRISASNAAVQRFSAGAAVPPISASNADVQPFSASGAVVPPISASNAAVQPVSTSGAAVPPISASNAAVQPFSASRAAAPPISASNAAVQPFSASRAAAPPISASNAAVQPFSASRGAVPPISASNAAVQPFSASGAAIPPVSDPSAFPSLSRSIDSTSIDSASHSSHSDAPATIVELYRRYGIPLPAPRNPYEGYSLYSPQRKVDPTNIGESSRSSEPSDSPPWTIEYAPPAWWTNDYTPPRSRSTLKDWSSSVIAKYQSYFHRKSRSTASISLSEDDFVVVDKDMEGAKDEDDDFVVVSDAKSPDKENPVD